MSNKYPGAALTQREILGQTERVQAQIVEQLSIFLRQLHAIPRSEVEQHGITTADSARGPAEWEAMFHEAERELFPLLMADAREWVTGLFAPVLEGRLSLEHTPALIHGDLGPYHLLFDREEKRLNGVIDFGTGGLGDPADDFACLINGLGESFLRRMAKFHPEIEAAIDRARFMAGTLEVQWALSGLRTKDLSWFTVHLGRARDVRPMGAAWG